MMDAEIFKLYFRINYATIEFENEQKQVPNLYINGCSLSLLKLRNLIELMCVLCVSTVLDFACFLRACRIEKPLICRELGGFKIEQIL